MWIKIPGENVTFAPGNHPGRPHWLFHTLPAVVRVVAETTLGMACAGALAIVLYQHVLAGWLIAPGWDAWLWRHALIVVPIAAVLVSARALWDRHVAGRSTSQVWLESLHDTMWTTYGWVRNKPAPVWDSEEFPDLFWSVDDPANMLDPRAAARALALHWVAGFIHEADGSIDADDADWMSDLVGRGRAVVIDGDGQRHEFGLRDLLFTARCLAPGVWPSFAWEGFNDTNDPNWKGRTAAHGTALRAWLTNHERPPMGGVLDLDEQDRLVLICNQHRQVVTHLEPGTSWTPIARIIEQHSTAVPTHEEPAEPETVPAYDAD